MRPSEVAAAFVARINTHDLAGIGELMTEDHVFVDALENRTAGRAAMLAGWQHYFALVSDYWIRVDRVFEDGCAVALFGSAGGKYQGTAWEVPAAWLSEVREERVAVWRVYVDNQPLRQLINANAG